MSYKTRSPPTSTVFPYTTLFRSDLASDGTDRVAFDSSGGCHNGALTAGVTAASSGALVGEDRKSTRLNSSHANISYAVFCLKKKMAAGSLPRTLELWYRSSNAAQAWL